MVLLTDYSGLGTPPDQQGNGVTAHAHRKIIQSLWSNPGIIGGRAGGSLAVTGGNDLRYRVEEGCAVIARDTDATEGYYECYAPAATTDPVPAGDTTNPRIDVIWLKVNDLDFDDKPEGATQDTAATNRLELGVTCGTPATNPTEPAVPARALKLAAMRLPAGATTTQTATRVGDIDYAVPYGGNLGVLARIAENKDGQLNSNPPYKNPILSGKFYFPTDRWVYMHAYLCVSTPSKTSQGNTAGVAAVQFYVDGEKYTTRKVRYSESWVTYEVTANVQVSAGEHTLGIAMYKEEGSDYITHYSNNDPDDRGNYYVGRVLVIKDWGVAK